MRSKIFTILTMLLTTTFFSSTAQKASFENDTARYEGRTFVAGDTITLGYGSKSNKDFAFIGIGSAMGGLTDLKSSWSKSEAVIDKIYVQRNKVYLRAKLTDKTVNALGGNKLFIDLEGSIDNKELR
jgi:hypothetical protein